IDGVREGAAAALDRFEITAAIDRIWELVRWLNRHVTERRPWELARDDARGGAARPRGRVAGRGRRARRLPAGDRRPHPRRARPAARPLVGPGRLRAA